MKRQTSSQPPRGIKTNTIRSIDIDDQWYDFVYKSFEPYQVWIEPVNPTMQWTTPYISKKRSNNRFTIGWNADGTTLERVAVSRSSHQQGRMITEEDFPSLVSLNSKKTSSTAFQKKKTPIPTLRGCGPQVIHHVPLPVANSEHSFLSLVRNRFIFEMGPWHSWLDVFKNVGTEVCLN
jgi:hypothetical protein